MMTSPKSSSTIVTPTHESFSLSQEARAPVVPQASPDNNRPPDASSSSFVARRQEEPAWVTPQEEAWLKTALAVCVLRKRHAGKGTTATFMEQLVASTQQQQQQQDQRTTTHHMMIPTFSSASHLETIMTWASRRLDQQQQQQATMNHHHPGRGGDEIITITPAMMQAVPSTHICQQLSFLSTEDQQEWMYQQLSLSSRMMVLRVLLVTTQDPMLHIAILQALCRHICEALEEESTDPQQDDDDDNDWHTVQCLKLLHFCAVECRVLAPATCLDFLENLFGMEVLLLLEESHYNFSIMMISQHSRKALIQLSLHRLVQVLLQDQQQQSQESHQSASSLEHHSSSFQNEPEMSLYS